LTAKPIAFISPLPLSPGCRVEGSSARLAANDLLPRLRADPQLGRFWAHRGEDGVKREKHLKVIR
jgi:hypothetical protein